MIWIKEELELVLKYLNRVFLLLDIIDAQLVMTRNPKELERLIMDDMAVKISQELLIKGMITVERTARLENNGQEIRMKLIVIK